MIVVARHGNPRYEAVVAELTAEPLASQWWQDAESYHEDGISYMVAMAADESGQLAPAAWAGWRVVDGILKCCNNYERQGIGRRDELYRLAYRARHRQIVAPWRGPAVTYLFPEPIGLHLADGWYRTGVTGPGELAGHVWWELRRGLQTS
jgi:hypothetical protein